MAASPKIICIGLNYHDHALEQGAELPTEPLLFGKFASALIGPDEAIVLPPESTHVDAEAELAVVIGDEGRRVSEADALKLVAGYTVANDVTARDLQKSDGQWLRAKGFDTFCPLLPGVVPVSELGDGSGLRIVQRLNGEALQDSSTSELIFGVPDCLAAYEALTARGAMFLTPPVTYDWEIRAFFRDPDGHLFEITERRSAGARP